MERVIGRGPNKEDFFFFFLVFMDRVVFALVRRGGVKWQVITSGDGKQIGKLLIEIEVDRGGTKDY